jgi:hypothetical protein
MKRFRIPIAAVMAVIALVALELAALRLGSEAWVDLTRYLTVATLAAATYLARYRRGDHGNWWFGFALFGWAYFAMVLDALGRRSFAFGLRPMPSGAPILPPVTLLGLLRGGEVSDGPSLLRLLWNRYEILQSILTLIVALAGGVLCGILAHRRGAPFEEVQRTGRLVLDGEEPAR